jgi:hypothetical protein
MWLSRWWDHPFLSLSMPNAALTRGAKLAVPKAHAWE